MIRILKQAPEHSTEKQAWLHCKPVIVRRTVLTVIWAVYSVSVPEYTDKEGFCQFRWYHGSKTFRPIQDERFFLYV